MTTPNAGATDEQIAEWEALAEKATQGPWGTAHHSEHPKVEVDYVTFVDGYGSTEEICTLYADDATNGADAAFIAASRTAVPRLITALRDRDATIASYRVAHETTLRHATEANATIAELRAYTAQNVEMIALLASQRDEARKKGAWQVGVCLGCDPTKAALERALSDLAACKVERDEARHLVAVLTDAKGEKR